MTSTLVSIYINSPRTGHTIKANCIKFQNILNFDFLEKGLGLVSPTFCESFFEKHIPHVISY